MCLGNILDRRFILPPKEVGVFSPYNYKETFPNGDTDKKAVQRFLDFSGRDHFEQHQLIPSTDITLDCGQ